jgi:uncharacterized membrane protein YgaE (UPF0421/DUF939 family)
MSIRDQIFRSSFDRWKHATRIAVTAALATLVTLIFQPNQVYWVIVTVFILSMSDVGTTWIKTLERVIATILAFVAAIVMVAMFSQTPALLFLSFVLVISAGLYVSLTHNVAVYTGYLTVITLIIVLTPTWSDPESLTGLGLERAQAVCIGVIVTSVLACLLWPTSAPGRFKALFTERLERADARLERIGDFLVGREMGKQVNPEPLATLSLQVATLKAAMAESVSFRLAKGKWLGRVTVINRMAVQSEILEAQIGAADWTGVPQRVREEMEKCVSIVRVEWQRMGENILAERDPYVDMAFLEGAATSLEAERVHGLDSNRLVAVTTLLLMIRQLGRMSEMLLWQGRYSDTPLLGDVAVAPRRPTWRQHYDHFAMLTTVKAVVSVVIALIVISTMKWTGSMATAIVTALLITQPTIGASWNKSMQRVIGVVFGAGFGLVILVTVEANASDVWWLLTGLFFASFIAGWFMAGDWEISYVGLQMGVALGLVLGASAASNSFAEPIGRVSGIIVGVIIAMVVLRMLWPVWAREQVGKSMADASTTIADMLEVGLRTPQEEVLARPSNGWLYNVGWSLSEAYRYREEARYESGISPTRSSPVLELASLLQDAMPRVMLLIQARHDHFLVDSLVRHKDLVVLRTAIQNRFRSVADICLGRPVVIEDLHGPLAVASEVFVNGTEQMDGTQRVRHLEVLGYYQELVPDLDAMVLAAEDAATLFLTQAIRPARSGA